MSKETITVQMDKEYYEKVTSEGGGMSGDVQGIINSLYSSDCNDDYNNDFTI